MPHQHFCDVAGHEWECRGTALRHLRGDTEPSVCVCVIHRTELEYGDHSGCSIELLACPEHREELLRRMEEAGKAEPNIPEGWEGLFRPMTPAERLKSVEDHQFMEQVIFVGLDNINTGFDSPSIHHFSPADFGKVIDRCEHLHVHPNGIEVFTNDGGFIECVFAMDDGSPDESYDWARRLVQKYREVPNISMSATFNVGVGRSPMQEPIEAQIEKTAAEQKAAACTTNSVEGQSR